MFSTLSLCLQQTTASTDREELSSVHVTHENETAPRLCAGYAGRVHCPSLYQICGLLNSFKNY